LGFQPEKIKRGFLTQNKINASRHKVATHFSPMQHIGNIEKNNKNSALKGQIKKAHAKRKYFNR
jgi:hypothetical protein